MTSEKYDIFLGIFRPIICGLILLLLNLIFLKEVLGDSGSRVNEDRDRAVLFTIYSKEEIVSAYGLVLKPASDVDMNNVGEGVGASVAEKRAAVVRRGNGSRWEIQVDLLSEDYIANSKVSVITLTRSGDVIAAPTQLVGLSGAQVVKADAVCQSNTVDSSMEKIVTLSDADLSALVEIRRKKRKLLLVKLREALTPSVLNTLSEFEETHGLQAKQRLSFRMSLSDLTWRLGILDAKRP